jgi:hypothetical protein
MPLATSSSPLPRATFGFLVSFSFSHISR